jgi:hypothetical protein
VPTYDGQPIFGAGVQMTTQDNPRVSQINGFFGLSGLESLDGGLQGRYTSATGMLYGGTIDALNSAEQFFRSYNDGGAYVLVDDYFNIWPEVKLESFAPEGRKFYMDPFGYCERYTARFLHLL